MIVILGSPNGPQGELLGRAMERLGKGIEEWKRHSSYLIACTGGIGPFNPTDKPHAFYAAQYLIKQGIPKEKIVEPVESKNTVQDAQLLGPLLKKYHPQLLIVVTSDFHMPRARYIFEHLYPNMALFFSEAKTKISPEEYAELQADEEKKLHWHHRNGIQLS